MTCKSSQLSREAQKVEQKALTNLYRCFDLTISTKPRLFQKKNK